MAMAMISLNRCCLVREGSGVLQGRKVLEDGIVEAWSHSQIPHREQITNQNASPPFYLIFQQNLDAFALELDPEEIILFGSYAWGIPHKYSDLDLCVIVPDGIVGFNRIEWGVRALNALNELNVDVDVLIKTRSDVETFKTVPASLTRKIVEQGKLLYEQGKASSGQILA